VIFIQFAQYLGTHVPALGAFLVSLCVVVVLCLVSYKLGRHTTNNRWRWDVEHMPAVIGQDIRERKDREIAVLQDRVELLRERLRILEPLSSGVIDLVRRSTEPRAAGGNK